MGFGVRTLGAAGAIIVLAVAGLLYSASDRMSMAGRAAADSREATLQAYRIAQSLKSLANGYELAMNEYYSTVLEFSGYQKKATEQKAAIDRELAALATLKDGDTTGGAELNRSFREMETYRLALESAMSGADKDWDGAREALYKLNLLSVRTIQQADTLARVADERAQALDKDWLAHQSQALDSLRVAMVLALATAVLILSGALRAKRACAEPTCGS
jgi:hypothetical protein